MAALENADEGLSTTEIVSLAHLASRNAADVLLSNMANDGQIERVRRGIYGLPGTTAKITKINKKDKKEGEYGENPTKHHTPHHTPQSYTSKATTEPDHTPCIEFLTWALRPGRRLVRDIEASARAEGVLGEHQRIDKAKSLQDAKRILKVVVEREGFGPGSQVYWRLPDVDSRQDAHTDGGATVHATPTREPEGGQ